MLIGFGMALAVVLLLGGIALNSAVQSAALTLAEHTGEVVVIVASIVLLVAFLALMYARIRRVIRERWAIEHAWQTAQQPFLKAGALQDAIFNSANFSSIATDAQGVIQIFNVGAERMLGYKAVDVMDKITPAGISDAQELIARAAALSQEFDTPIMPGFEALVFKASRGIEDIYELTYIR